MTIDDFSPSTAARTAYDFSSARAGASMWVETAAQRIALYQAFQRWTDTTGSNLAGKTVKVGDDDPRGEGYRLVFTSKKVSLKPVVLSRLPKWENLVFTQEHILKSTGLLTNEDILDAAMSCTPIPTTVTEANAISRLIWAGNTPKQIDYCIERYGMTWREHTANAQARGIAERAAERERRMAPYRVTPEMRRGDLDEIEG